MKLEPAKIASVVGLVVLAFLFGSGIQVGGWFPASHLERAWLGFHQLTRGKDKRPHHVTDKVFDREGVRNVRPDRTGPGLTLISSAWRTDGEWRPGLRLIDRDGNVVHEWSVTAAEVFRNTDLGDLGKRKLRYANVSEFYLFPDGDLIVNFGYVGTARIDSCSEVVWTVPRVTHHSVARDPDGSFWVPGNPPTKTTKTPKFPDGYPGLEEPVHMDTLLNVSAEGRVVDEINLLDLLHENGLLRYLFKHYRPLLVSGEPIPPDVTHLNDIDPLEADLADEYSQFDTGDLLLSIRDLDLVVVVDPDTRTVEWHGSEPLLAQHDPDFIGDGTIAVFDNNYDTTDRGTHLGGSRIVAFHPEENTHEVLFPTDDSEPFYTAVGGRWQLLDNGNMLMAETKTGRVAEFGPDGRLVWEWVHASRNGETSEVYRAHRYQLSKRDVRQWECAEESSERD